MRLHFFQHVAFEGPGFIESWARQQGHQVSCTQFFDAGYRLPEVTDIDALIIMGGPMSVYDDHRYPWLHPEKIFIEDFIKAGKKVLGICLGAQLMAVCLGATVYTAANKEIGWYPVTPTEACSQLPRIFDLFKEAPVVFHWHGDKFEIPYDGSFCFLSSEANGNQAFYHNAHVIGLQFHLEVTEDSLNAMLEADALELTAGSYIQNTAQLHKGYTHIPGCNRIMAQLLNEWSS